MKVQKIAVVVLVFVALVLGQGWEQTSPHGFASQSGGTTGGAGGETVVVKSIGDLKSAAKGSGKKIIIVEGQMGDNSTGSGNNVEIGANKTILGVPGSKIKAWLTVRGNNVILRNLTIEGPGAVDVDGQDALNISGVSNIWVDHCDISDGQDGNLDVINGANYVTISWTRFSYSSKSKNHMYCNLIGNKATKTSDRGKLKTTMHHNWWDDGVIERMPRVRFGQVHVVNNLVSSNKTNYAVRAAIESDILVEGNVFNCGGKAIEIYESSGKVTGVTVKDNIFGPKIKDGYTKGKGTSFTPSYNTSFVEKASGVESRVRKGAGATLSDPRKNIPEPKSSSSVIIEPSSSSSELPVSSQDPVSSEEPSSSSIAPIEVSVKIQAEKYCEANGVLESDHLGFEGTGYFNPENNTGSKAMYKVNSDGAKSATMVIRYANGSTSARDYKITVNGSEQATMTMPISGAWTTWLPASAQVNLSQGQNKIELISTGSEGGPNTDWFGFKESGISEASCEDAVSVFGSGIDQEINLNQNQLLVHLQESSQVKFQISNMLGMRVAEWSQTMGAGVYQYDLESSVEGSGSYLVKVQVSSHNPTVYRFIKR